MKKILLILTLLMGLTLSSTYSVKAFVLENDERLIPYLNEINFINNKYNSDYYILSEKEFYESSLTSTLTTYEEYINSILTQDINQFRTDLINAIEYTESETIEVNIDAKLRSSYGTKTLSFFNGNNSMTLRYKYTGSIFDTSYKPSVTVSRISTTMFFDMSSYTGSFINRNTTYTVTAYGRVITTTGIANNKNYTVNFNL